MTSIITTTISLASTQTVPPAQVSHPAREPAPSVQVAQQQIAQASQIMAERNTSASNSQRRNTLNVQDRVQGKFAPQEQKGGDGKKRVAQSRHSPRKATNNLDVEV